jgi:molecular chaperone Hsp33
VQREIEDHIVVATTAESTIRLIGAVTTNLVAEGCRRHQTSLTASAALGRALTGALLFGNTFKDLEYVTLRFDCRGPIGGIIAEANAHGTVRGYVRNPLAEAEPLVPGKLNVSGIVGRGILHVIREAGHEIGLAKEPYIGAVPIVSGEIAEDLAHYLASSEQINSAVGLGVYIDPDGERVTAAGGYLIQVMPGIEEGTLARLEATLAQAPHVTERIRRGASAEELLLEAIGDFELTVLNRRPVAFSCTCSYERAINIVTALGTDEVADMLEKDHGARLTCHFCGESYELDAAALQAILSPQVN